MSRSSTASSWAAASAISLHGSHRVAGDRYLFAMPEVGDRLLSRMSARPMRCRACRARPASICPDRRPGRARRRARARACDPCACRSARSRTVRDALVGRRAGRRRAGGSSPDAARRSPACRQRARRSTAALPGPTRRRHPGAPRRSCRAGLASSPRKTAATHAHEIAHEPRVAFEQMRRGADLDFEDAMRTEFRIVSRIVDGHDFYEGVRAA